MKKLKTQLVALQKKLTRLQARPRSARAQILDVARANNSLRDIIHGQQLAVAGARSMLAGMQVIYFWEFIFYFIEVVFFMWVFELKRGINVPMPTVLGEAA